MGDKQVSHKSRRNNHTSFISYLIIERINCANLLKKKMYPGSNDVGDDCQREITISTRNETNTSASGNKTSFIFRDLSTFFGLKMLVF